jgi:hypothetical protein
MDDRTKEKFMGLLIEHEPEGVLSLPDGWEIKQWGAEVRRGRRVVPLVPMSAEMRELVRELETAAVIIDHPDLPEFYNPKLPKQRVGLRRHRVKPTKK